jgi:hypothetical protein
MAKSYLSRLIDEFGVIEDPLCGGFILPDGLFLDLSGGAGRRVHDHRIVNGVLPAGHGIESRYDAMAHVSRVAGMYRWFAENWAVEAWTAPTRGQLGTIEYLCMISPRNNFDGRRLLEIEANGPGGSISELFDPSEAKQAMRFLRGAFR